MALGLEGDFWAELPESEPGGFQEDIHVEDGSSQGRGNVLGVAWVR